ncbi:hypothetical protein ACFSTC_36565 [Nonomuraea ferruginea]
MAAMDGGDPRLFPVLVRTVLLVLALPAADLRPRPPRPARPRVEHRGRPHVKTVPGLLLY